MKKEKGKEIKMKVYKDKIDVQVITKKEVAIIQLETQEELKAVLYSLELYYMQENRPENYRQIARQIWNGLPGTMTL